MSTVFAATNMVTGKQVAIKWLHPEVLQDETYSQQLLREAQAASAVDHPNVVNVFDVAWHQGALFLVMELLHGESLSELLQRESLAPSALVKLMMPVLRGVHAAHRTGVVHRDLKPDNIFLCRDPHGEAREPKVLDFGISKLADGDATAPEPGHPGTVFGTPQYMAPEQLRDSRLADARSDVYALGVIFYRALAEEYPHDADTLTALTLQVLEGEPPPLDELRPELDPGLCAVIMRALELAPAARFQSVAEFAEALEPYAEGVRFAASRGERDTTGTQRRERSAFVERPRAERASAPPRASEALEVLAFDDGPQSPAPRERAPLTRTLLVGAALFALGSLAPIGWQLSQTGREPAPNGRAISAAQQPEPSAATAPAAGPDNTSVRDPGALRPEPARTLQPKNTSEGRPAGGRARAARTGQRERAGRARAESSQDAPRDDPYLELLDPSPASLP